MSQGGPQSEMLQTSGHERSHVECGHGENSGASLEGCVSVSQIKSYILQIYSCLVKKH